MSEKQHLYQSIYESLLKDICDGTLAEGSRLPSESELTEQFNVSRITTKKALNMLSENGYIVRRPGLGSYVRNNTSEQGECVGNGIDSASNVEMALHNDGKTGIVGLVMDDFTDSYGLELLRAVEKRTYELGYYLCLRRSMGRQEIEKHVIEQLLALKVDGIIVMPTHGHHYNTELLKMVVSGFPIVFVDRFLNGIPAPYVGTNNYKASLELTEYLFSMGHTSIAVITPPAAESITLRDRVGGFRAAYEKHGIEQDRNLLLDTIRSTLTSQEAAKNIQTDEERIEAFLTEHPEITAVIATEYPLAVMVRQATQRMGLRIPEDISLTCFDSPITLQGVNYFTHIEQNEKEMGTRSVDLLRSQIVIKNSQPRQSQVILDAKIINGFSVRQV